MSDSVRPHRRQPTRLLRPWDSPGKNTGVGCHFFLQCMKVKSESEVAQSFLTLCDPMDCSPPGSSVHGIFQARVLEWGAFAFSATQFFFNVSNSQDIEATLYNLAIIALNLDWDQLGFKSHLSLLINEDSISGFLKYCTIVIKQYTNYVTTNRH